MAAAVAECGGGGLTSFPGPRGWGGPRRRAGCTEGPSPSTPTPSRPVPGRGSSRGGGRISARTSTNRTGRAAWAARHRERTGRSTNAQKADRGLRVQIGGGGAGDSGGEGLRGTRAVGRRPLRRDCMWGGCSPGVGVPLSSVNFRQSPRTGGGDPLGRRWCKKFP